MGYPTLLALNILGILFMTGSGIYGGMIYRLQLAAIQFLKFRIIIANKKNSQQI